MSSIQKRNLRTAQRDERGEKVRDESGGIVYLPTGRVIWYARYRDAAGKERTRSFARKVDAQRWLNEVTGSVVTGRYVAPDAGKATLRDFTESTWLPRATTGRAHKSRSGGTYAGTSTPPSVTTDSTRSGPRTLTRS